MTSIVESFKTDKALADAEAAKNPPTPELKKTLLQIDHLHPHRERYEIKRNGAVEKHYIEVNVLGRYGVRIAKNWFGQPILYDDNEIREKVYGDFEITLIDEASRTTPDQTYDDHGFYFGIPFGPQIP